MTKETWLIELEKPENDLMNDTRDGIIRVEKDGIHWYHYGSD